MLMTLTELTSIGSVIAVVAGGTLWLETRYVQREDVQAIETAMNNLAERVEVGHTMAELRAISYTVESQLSDLEGRSLMYRAFEQAGVITPEQRSRWQELLDDISIKRGELTSLTSRLNSLQ